MLIINNNIIILDKFIEITWTGKNKKHYIELGYSFTKIGDVFKVSFKDISCGCHVKVKVKCPDCEKIREVVFKDIGKVGHTICRKCCYKITKRRISKDIKIYDSYAEILIVDTKDRQYKMYLDIEDLHYLEEGSLYVNDDYAYLYLNNKVFGIHRIIMNAKNNIRIDHINHNTLDNRKNNLRLVNNSQNMMNRVLNKNNKSGVKGVYYREDYNIWQSYITINKKRISKNFYFKEDAIKWRKKMEELYFGEYNYNEELINYE